MKISDNPHPHVAILLLLSLLTFAGSSEVVLGERGRAANILTLLLSRAEETQCRNFPVGALIFHKHITHLQGSGGRMPSMEWHSTIQNVSSGAR